MSPDHPESRLVVEISFTVEARRRVVHFLSQTKGDDLAIILGSVQTDPSGSVRPILGAYPKGTRAFFRECDGISISIAPEVYDVLRGRVIDEETVEGSDGSTMRLFVIKGPRS